MAKITYLEHNGTAHVIEVSNGTEIYTLSLHDALPIFDRLPAKDPMEADMLDFAWQPDAARSRLTCQIKVTSELDGLVVQLPEKQI